MKHAAWLTPINNVRPIKRVVTKDGRLMPPLRLRSVEIDGVWYESLTEAKNALGHASYNKLYRAMGESWRYDKRKAA